MAHGMLSEMMAVLSLLDAGEPSASTAVAWPISGHIRLTH
jgi:hypothetical protein